MTFYRRERVRVVNGQAKGREGVVVKIFPYCGETWYEVDIGHKTVCRGPAEDFERVRDED